MDANLFLSLRLDMIESFYKRGSAPFRSIMDDIEAERPPYEGPFYGDEPEPPHQSTWQQSQDAVLLMGAVSLSLLAGALQVFLDTMVKAYGNLDAFKKVTSQGGWWGRHQTYFKMLGLDLSHSGADLELLSAMILARNSVMHQEGLINSTPVFRDGDLAKMKSQFFISPLEEAMLKGFDEGEEDTFLFAPNIDVDEQKLAKTISEVRKLTTWLEAACWELRRSPSFTGPVVRGSS